MSGYNYAPPPPPPQASQSGHHGYGHHGGRRYQQHGPSRGGGAPTRGRGGYASGGRPEHQAPPQYEYGGAYASHTSGYPGTQHQAGGYPPAQHQWPHDHGHPANQHQPHAPAPLSNSNYHPNYAPQNYGGTHAQPPPAHQPSYGAPPPPQPPQQYHYPAPTPAPAPAHAPAPAPAPVPYASSQSWSGHERSQPPQYGGSPHRGGYGGERGGSRAPSIGAPLRAEYANAPTMQPQVSSGYAQPYPDPRSGVSYPVQPQYPQYAPPPPPPTSMPKPGREPYYKHDGHHSGHHSGRGRGGYRGGGNHRGKQPHHAGDKMRPRHQPHQGHHGNHGQQGQRDGGPPQKQDNNSGKKKKRKTNTLGLTPGQDSESEDDEKEEEKLSKLLGHDALQISDLDAYVAERKKNFPTAARAKAKKDGQATNGQKGKRTANLEKEELMAIELRKQLEKVESSIKRKREQQDEGDEMRDGPVSGTNSDNDQPEALSSRPQQRQPGLPAKKADISKHCKYFSTGGTCGKKGKCRFVHDPEVREAAMKEREANNGQLTIQQRLILNDKDQEDLTVLQSIQYLREKGLVSEDAVNDGQEDQSTKPSNRRQTSSLPVAPPSLPKPPVKRESGLPPHTPPPSALQLAKSGGEIQYKGWNLSGYGNSGLKTDDLP